MRAAHGIYRTLQQYVEEADRGGFDEDIDMDFRSVSYTNRDCDQQADHEGRLAGNRN